MPFRFREASPRIWGTRFDSLIPSSPPSELCSSGGSTHTQLSSSPRKIPVDLHSTETTLEKMPHDASIFVGSLPSDVDQRELTRVLAKHLAEHVVIRSIKVVRDTRGSVCAFVQCEDAAAADKLIQTLQSNPSQPVLGRHLRYEKARSLRSLFLSYCAPTQYIPASTANSSTTPSTFDDGTQGLTVPIEPATAMRIFRSQGARYLSIIYNSHAESPTCDDGGLFLSPLMFDAESIAKIVSFFGPIDSISRHNTTDAVCQPPHDCPRSPGMDPSVWEVKFNHRSDALSALMTLRTVPHLSVTWAHQTNEAKETSRPQGPVSTPNSISLVDGDGCETSWGLRNAQAHTSSDSTFPSHAPIVDHVDHSFSSYPRLPSFTDDDFPPLTGKQGSWADDAMAAEDESMLTLRTDVSSEYADNIPPTPDFTTSSITPMTPKTTSGFPQTPRSGNFESTHNSYDGPHYDPTSLFVGGLPAYWKDENVRDIFGRFVGLESVQVIRPQLKKGAAFAFVKFDNTDSPQQAIREEHDRLHDHRHIRVQLRDLNPPGTFGRRNRLHCHEASGNQMRISANGLRLDAMGIHDDVEPEAVRFVDPAASVPPQVQVPPTPEKFLDFPPSIEVKPQISTSSSPVSPSPPPSSSENSASAHQPALLHYPVPFYAQTPWMTGYPPQYTYPVQYVPGYPAFVPTPSYIPPTGSIGPGHYAIMPPTDSSSSHQPIAQPPLRPTGFIQGEHGTLVPVYPAEALERYMSDNLHTGAPTTPKSPTGVSTPVPAAALPQYPQPQMSALPFVPQTPIGWAAHLPSQNPIIPGPFVYSPSSNGYIPPTHRVQSLQFGPGSHEPRGKRQYRQHNNVNRAPQSSHRFHHGNSNSFESTPQMPAPVQDWTMWTGGR